MKLPAGMIVKQIIDEKNLKAADVGSKIGISRQSVYQSYAKMNFSEQEVEKWSTALGVSKDDFMQRWEQSNIGSVGPAEYLTDYLHSLEQKFIAMTEQSKALSDQLKDQIAVKDRQIERLMDLLGKLSPAPVKAMVSKRADNIIKLKAA